MAAGRRAGRSDASRGWLAVAAILAAALGGTLGGARLGAIDAGAFTGRPGARVSVRGFVAAVPRRSDGEVRVRIDTAAGRLLLSAPEPVPDLAVGHEVRARGTVREPRDWEAAYLARFGIARVVETSRIATTGRRRGGLAYLTDSLRERAEGALGQGTPPAEAALLRGFVLGQDDRIDPATIEEFQRSGLAHLLAVSGQNVLLLGLLAMLLLGLLGLALRARLLCVLALVAVYVPVAGAGASIQRAGVMGAAAIVATLASRPASRWYALLLAAAVTLALNPRASGDVGWQLSFAAVAGIALWAGPLRDALAGARPTSTGAAAARRRRLRAAVAEGAAVTLAATIATAPLMAHHFDRLSIAALPANLLALPAVAPVMWLGMLASAAAQLPWLPVEPLTFLAGLFAAYIEQVAHSLGAPGWAQVSAPIAASTAVALSALLLGAGWLLRSRAGLRHGLGPRRWAPAALALALAAAVSLAPGPGGEPPAITAGLRATVLDVGQGDAILLDPSPGDPVLVDVGPPEADVADRLEADGVDRLAAVVLTHDERDHSGGLGALLRGLDVSRIAYGWPARPALAEARAAAAQPIPLSEGSEIDAGALRLEVLWPPRALLDGPAPSEPNDLSVVLLARWHRFRMLLTGDGEAASVPLDPGPVDVLKVAHHGSADTGLGRLLDRSTPRLAVISVGADNPYGHPSPETLSELAARGIPTLRTDRSGDIDIQVEAGMWSVQTDE